MPKPSSTKKATLVDVARAAGVGPMTVSRTINGHPYVSEATAKRVHAAIRKLGYRPNQAARMLTGQLSKSIGLIVPDIADPFFAMLCRGVQKAAREAGYLVWLAASDGDSATEAAEIEQMTHHPVDGILLAPLNSRSKHLKVAAAGSIPIVTIDRPIEVASTDSVVAENRVGAQLAVEHLRSHGYVKIACIAMNFHLRPIKLRVAAYEEYLHRTGLPAKRLVLKDEANALAALRELFLSADRPDALFTTNNLCTSTVIRSLRALGIRIREDVALIGFDDVELYAMLSPSVTSVRQPELEIGRIATQLLFDRIRGDTSSSSVRRVLPVTLVLRESCGCKR